MSHKLVKEDSYNREFSKYNIFIVFKHYNLDKYSYDYEYDKHSNIIRRVMMEVYFKRDDGKYDEGNRLGFYIADIDRYGNIHGNIAEVKSFISKNKEEKEAMKGLGKFMLCTLTRYIVDVYGINTDNLFYGEAVGGTPHFVENLYKIYHPLMCQVSDSKFNEIINTTVSKSGRIIPPLLSDEELKLVTENMLLISPAPVWNREEQLGPSIDIEENVDIRKAVEILLLFPEKRLEFIKNCIRKIFPSTWEDITQNLNEQVTYRQIISNMRGVGIPESDFEISYYENIMCEILATHRLMNYYQNEFGFVINDKTNGRAIKMSANIGVRLEKCKKPGKEFYMSLEIIEDNDSEDERYRDLYGYSDEESDEEEMDE
jgi:uncharacterized protein Veg